VGSDLSVAERPVHQLVDFCRGSQFGPYTNLIELTTIEARSNDTKRAVVSESTQDPGQTFLASENFIRSDEGVVDILTSEGTVHIHGNFRTERRKQVDVRKRKSRREREREKTQRRKRRRSDQL
jgi:hypothetical protein